MFNPIILGSILEFVTNMFSSFLQKGGAGVFDTIRLEVDDVVYDKTSDEVAAAIENNGIKAVEEAIIEWEKNHE